MALNVNWMERRTNQDVYGAMPRVTTKIQKRRMRLAGHCIRHDDLVAHKLILWEPTHGHRSRGRPKLSYVDNLRKDMELKCTDEIRALMNDRTLWRSAIDSRTLQPP